MNQIASDFWDLALEAFDIENKAPQFDGKVASRRIFDTEVQTRMEHKTKRVGMTHGGKIDGNR